MTRQRVRPTEASARPVFNGSFASSELAGGGEVPQDGALVATSVEGDSMAKKKKSESIYVTRFDKTRLLRMLARVEAAAEERPELEDLEMELERGTEVEPSEIAPDVVTMNSRVRVTDLDTDATHLYTIVFPWDADYENGRISILSPLGTALHGYRAGDEVSWTMPGGTRRLRIEELVYQPEAAGDFHL